MPNLQRMKGLTPKQLRVAAALANPEYDKVHVRELCEEFHLSTATFYKWRRDPEFLAEVTAIARDAALLDVRKVYRSLLAKAETGNVNAIKTFLTHFDNYTERTASDVNAQVAAVTIEFGKDELSEAEVRAMKEDENDVPSGGEGGDQGEP